VSALLRHIRLLPLVIVVGFSLLTVKGLGLLREAQAEDAGRALPAEQSAPAATAPADPAADDNQMTTAAEVDVLTSLTRRRHQLDGRAQQIAMRENVLAAAERRVDNKIAELRALQIEIQKLLGLRDVEAQKQFDSLVKTYSAMKPKDAARIFNLLDDDIRVAVAQKMKSDVLAPVLAAMQSEEAQKLTLRLADRLKVTPPALTPPPAPAAPAPDGSAAQAAPLAAAAVPPPAQTAALSPPATPPATQKPGG
jgi:flagellar motility protein MotE (MotC chaperone)